MRSSQALSFSTLRKSMLPNVVVPSIGRDAFARLNVAQALQIGLYAPGDHGSELQGVEDAAHVVAAHTYELNLRWLPSGNAALSATSGVRGVRLELKHQDAQFLLHIESAAELDRLDSTLIEAFREVVAGMAPHAEFENSYIESLPEGVLRRFRFTQAQPLIDAFGTFFNADIGSAESVVSAIDAHCANNALHFIAEFGPVASPNVRFSLCGSLEPLNSDAVSMVRVAASRCAPSDERIEWVSSWPLDLTWSFSQFSISLSETKRLETGDVVLIDRCADGWELCLESKSPTVARAQVIGLSLLAIRRDALSFEPLNDPADIQSVADVIWKEFVNEGISMNEVDPLRDLAQHQGQHKILEDALSLRLRVSFAATEISYRELSGFVSGNVINLNQLIENAVVQIECGGVAFAAGKIVAIGDYLGVQITQLHAARSLEPTSATTSAPTRNRLSRSPATADDVVAVAE